MQFLAIDSTGHFSSVGVFEIVNNEILTIENKSNLLNEKLTNTINKLTSDIIRNHNTDKIEFIVISIGPGSFTKIRASLSFAKGLSLGLNAPVIGVNGFHKLFEVGLRLNGEKDGLLLACDTFRKSIFVSLQDIGLKKSFNNNIKTLSINDIKHLRKLRHYSTITVLGDLADQVNEELKSNGFKIHENVKHHYGYEEVGLRALVKIALKIIKNNQKFDLEPIYLSMPIINKRKNLI